MRYRDEEGQSEGTRERGRRGDTRRKKEREGRRCKNYKVSTKPSLPSLQ